MLLNAAWQEITANEQLVLIQKESFNQPVVIFKHSTSCGISNHVMHELNEDWEMLGSKSIKFYYLDLLSYRDLSNRIAEEYGVIHQSPQAIIIENGQAKFSTSHFALKASLLAEKL